MMLLDFVRYILIGFVPHSNLLWFVHILPLLLPVHELCSQHCSFDLAQQVCD